MIPRYTVRRGRVEFIPLIVEETFSELSIPGTAYFPEFPPDKISKRASEMTAKICKEFIT